jgi:phosphoenolpyruvate-protein kinase (PTS system EI component)
MSGRGDWIGTSDLLNPILGRARSAALIEGAERPPDPSVLRVSSHMAALAEIMPLHISA